MTGEQLGMRAARLALLSMVWGIAWVVWRLVVDYD